MPLFVELTDLHDVHSFDCHEFSGLFVSGEADLAVRSLSEFTQNLIIV